MPKPSTHTTAIALNETRAAAYREAAELVAPQAHRCKCSTCSALREKAELLRAKADEIAHTTP